MSMTYPGEESDLLVERRWFGQRSSMADDHPRPAPDITRDAWVSEEITDLVPRQPWGAGLY
jgi:hypothetical protein